MDANKLADATVAIKTAFSAIEGVAGQAIDALAFERAAHRATKEAAAAAAATALDPNIFAAFAVDLANIVNAMNESANRLAAALQG